MQHSHPPNTIRTRITPAKAALFTTILVLATLLSLEGAIRIWAYYFRSTYETYNATKGRYEPVPGVHPIAGGPPLIINSKGFIGPEFEAEKPKDVYRIFSIGDSCTFGNMDVVYPGLVHTRLNAEGNGKKFEVLNAGVEGYHSGFALARLKEDVLQYNPDLVTIYVGWNDFMKVNPENLGEVGRYAWLGRLMEQSYLVKAYKKVLFSYVRPLVVKPNVVSTPEDLHAYDSFEPSGFRDNLVEMIHILKSRNIKILILTRPTVVREGMSYEDIMRQHVVFPWYGSAYSVNKLLSLHRAYNRTIRNVAIQEGVPLLDLDADFERRDRSGLFWDTMHPNEKGHRLIADQVFRRLQDVMQSDSHAGMVEASGSQG
ncbi:MAG: SGNH/GDSL hydrolase family protein [Nitrospira sp.]|nr:SGNH/GDSL hydrolase family protein [Nitrospira sp.]